MISKIQAILSLVPNAEVVIIDDTVKWISPSTSPVTDEQINFEIARLQADYDAKQYQRQRAADYPPITDYIDGVVKGDQAQIDKYIADCLAVKAKYPKPQE